MIAALFVLKNGVYFNDPRIDAWDKDRDALNYRGPFPVIAHPPCQLWGKFAKINYKRWGGEHNKPGNDGGMFDFALKSVRMFGGVLEHPASSYAWGEFGLVRPIKNQWTNCGNGEWTCEVWQSAYGHVANKKTWLFYKGKNPKELNWNKIIGEKQIGFLDSKRPTRNKPTVSKKEANSTPIEFKEELISLIMTTPPTKQRSE